MRGSLRLALASGLGQLLALMITCTGLFSKLLLEQNFAFPTSQSSLVYLSLALCYGPVLIARLIRLPPEERHQEVMGLLRRSWMYAFLAVADVEANFLLVLSYEYTSITSVTLLDCFALPVVMILSYFVLHSRYHRLHVLGVMVCVGGLGLLVGTEDQGDEGSGGATNPLLGDGLVLVGTSLYAISNVGQEKLVKDRSTVEWLAMVGFFGFLVSATQASILERPVFAYEWTGAAAAYLASFVASLFILYSLVPQMFILSSATFYNLSLITSDFYSAAAAAFVLKTPPTFWFFIAFSIVSVGLFTYHYTDIAPSAFPRCGIPPDESEDQALLFPGQGAGEDNHHKRAKRVDAQHDVDEQDRLITTGARADAECSSRKGE